jgi:RNA polymerase sigma-70 factor (ECF subfamily)
MPGTTRQKSRLVEMHRTRSPNPEPHRGRGEDAELVAAAKRGDPKAFESLFAKYHARVYNLIYRMVGNEDDAEDLTQETFVRCHRALPSLKAVDFFLPWLWRVATNICRDFARRRARRQTWSLDSEIVDDEGTKMSREIQDDSSDPPKLLRRSEVADRVQRALDKLSEDRRVVVILHHLEDVPVNEIAEMLGVPVGTVKSRLARARDDMSEMLSDLVDL